MFYFSSFPKLILHNSTYKIVNTLNTAKIIGTIKLPKSNGVNSPLPNPAIINIFAVEYEYKIENIKLSNNPIIIVFLTGISSTASFFVDTFLLTKAPSFLFYYNIFLLNVIIF